jgi:serine-type D-Ala-D-Ala carboxypeptidase (penicillin-binding protein 5/6)
LVPAVLLFIQLSVLAFWQGGSLTSSAAAEGQGLPGQPTVLGAFINTRGQEISTLEPVIPELSGSDLQQISAKSFLVYDAADGDNVLAGRSPDQKLQIASLTKLMTGLLAYENLDFSQSIEVGRSGLTNIHPIVNFADGDQVAIADIFSAMIVGSCNDAAQVLGRAIESRTSRGIADLMNEQAASLGMANTSFSNPVGFDSASNYSTARDLQKLIDKTQSFSVFTNLGKMLALQFKGVSGSNYRVAATNELLKGHDDILAIKTGFTAGAQGAMATKVLKNNHTIVILVLGSRDREQDTLTLKKLVVDPLVWQ